MLLFWILVSALSFGIGVGYSLKKIPLLSLISALCTICFVISNLTPRVQVVIYGGLLAFLSMISKIKKPM